MTFACCFFQLDYRNLKLQSSRKYQITITLIRSLTPCEYKCDCFQRFKYCWFTFNDYCMVIWYCYNAQKVFTVILRLPRGGEKWHVLVIRLQALINHGWLELIYFSISIDQLLQWFSVFWWYVIPIWNLLPFNVNYIESSS